LTSAVGEANIRFVEKFLQEEAIPVVSKDLGGTRGRMIYFHSDTFDIWRRYIKNDQVAVKVSEEEETAWRRTVSRLGTEGDVTLFS
jgi:chemotaxis protein CheD